MQHFIKKSAFTILLNLAMIAGKSQTADTSALTKQKDLQTVTVSSKKQFIVISAEKTTLNVGQSSIAAGSNVYELIKKAPGVSEQSDVLSYKGKTTKVLINGRPANLSGEDLKNLLSSMPGTGVDKIELLSNPSVKYDAQGGAVINIVMAKNKSFGTNYVLNTGAGSGEYAKANVGLDVNHREKNINIFGGYNFMHNKQIGRSNSTRFLENAAIVSKENSIQERNNNNYKFGLDYDLNKKSTIGFLVNGFINTRNRSVQNNAGIIYHLTNEDSVSNVSSKGNLTTKGPLANIYYKTTFDSGRRELTLNADYMRYDKTWGDSFTNRYYDTKGTEYAQPSFINNRSQSYVNVYSLTADYAQPFKKGKLEAGLKTSFTSTDNDVYWSINNGNGWVNDAGKTNHFIYKEMVSAAYANYRVDIKKWSLQTGLRAELTHTSGESITIDQNTKKNYLNLFPNVAAQFNKDDNNQFGISYRKSIYRYGFNYVNPFIVYQNQYAYSKGNPDIVPEISQSFELSYTYKQAYSASLNYTHGTKTLGEIYLQGAGNTTISSYGNYQSSDIFYLSLSAYKPVTKYWTVSVNPMFGYMMLNNSSATIANTNNKSMLITQLDLSNSFTFGKGWSAELGAMYISPFQYGSYKTKTFFTTDLGVSKSFLKNKASLKLTVSDIFNTLAYNKEVNYDGVKTTIDDKQESRFVNVAFRYKFGNNNVKAKTNRASKVSDIKNRMN